MSGKLKVTWGSGNVFLDLGLDKAEAENLKLRSELMMRIEEFYRKSGMTRAEAAKALGLTQPRLNALLKGKIGQFSLDALVNIASRAGMNVRLVVKKPACKSESDPRNAKARKNRGLTPTMHIWVDADARPAVSKD